MKEAVQHALKNAIGLAAFAAIIGSMAFAWQLLNTMPYTDLARSYALVGKDLTHNDILGFHAAEHDWQSYTSPVPPLADDVQAVYLSWEIPQDIPLSIDHILAATTNQNLCVYLDDRLIYTTGQWDGFHNPYGRTLHFIDAKQSLAGKRITFLLHTNYARWLGSVDYFFIGSELALFQKISISDAIYTASLAIAAALIAFLVMDIIWRGYIRRRHLQLYLIAFLLSIIFWATGTSSLFPRLFGTTQVWAELHFIMLYLMPMLFVKIIEHISPPNCKHPLTGIFGLYGALFAVATTAEALGLNGYMNMLFAFYPILAVTFLYPIFVLLGTSWAKHPACRYGVIAAASLMIFVAIDALHFEYHLFTSTLSATVFSIYAIIPFVFYLIREQMIQEAQLVRENNALVQELQVSQDEAKHDFLTGAFNRLQLEPSYERFASFAHEKGFSFSYAIFDIDHFKEVNDTRGHLGGDDALRGVAEIVQEKIDRRHIFIRYGGDEFILLALHHDLTQMAEFCESLRCAVAETMDGITISFGVSAWHGAGDTMHDLMERADRALYCSKEKGRNSVSTESEAACCDICANANAEHHR